MRANKEAAMDEIFVETILADPLLQKLLREAVLTEAASRIGQYPDGSLYAEYRVLSDDLPALASPEEAR